MVILDVICRECKKEFKCDTERKIGEVYKKDSPGSSEIIIEDCPHCGKSNRIEYRS